MDRERITAAMNQAWRRLAADGHARAGAFGPAVLYDHPTTPDAHGFVAIGELADPRHARTGIVLLHPATGSVRLAWATAG